MWSWLTLNWSLATVSGCSGSEFDAAHGAFPHFELNQMDIEGVDFGTCFTSRKEGLPPYDELILRRNRDTMDKDMIAGYSGSHREKRRIYSLTTRRKLGEELRATRPTLQTGAVTPAHGERYAAALLRCVPTADGWSDRTPHSRTFLTRRRTDPRYALCRPSPLMWTAIDRAD